jgi:hypothetical protein
MTFQTFSGKEYLKIDIAGSFGLDKLSWDERINWFDDNETKLQALVPQADEPALFYAGIRAWEKAKVGKPSGYPISLDATCSGIQILAVLAGDRKAAQICNVVDTGKREDAYVSIYQDMINALGETAKIDRKLTKQAIMTAFYSSTAVPKQVFGEGELLKIFYNTLENSAPGAWEINETMLAIWDTTALENSWVLPDNFHVKIKVMGVTTENVHFLNEPFEVAYEVNKPIKGGRSLGANMVHSIDGMVAREMQWRCNYDSAKVAELDRLLKLRAIQKNPSTHREQDTLVTTLWAHYQNSGFLSARILGYLDIDNLGLVDLETIERLIDDLPPKPFEIISIHDCFRCLPNYGNDLRWQYNNLLALLAESDLLSFVVSQICHRPIQADKLDPSLPIDIRQSNYALS